MLFDPKPESVREDLYDRERELEILHSSDDPFRWDYEGDFLKSKV